MLLAGKPLGKLVRDENDMRIYFPIPAERLSEGENVLRIEQPQARPPIDDIRVGEIKLHSRTWPMSCPKRGSTFVFSMPTRENLSPAG